MRSCIWLATFEKIARMALDAETAGEVAMERASAAAPPPLAPALVVQEVVPTEPQRVEHSHEQQPESPTPAAEQQAETPSMSTVFSVPIEKTEKGFGIYFTKREAASGVMLLVVDGLVDAPSESDVVAEAAALSESSEEKILAQRTLLQLGDALVGINGTSCQEKEVMEIIGLLRAAPLGSNTLQFSREPQQHDAEGELETVLMSDTRTSSITSSFLGALKKVKTKIKEGIEGDEELIQREQEEREQFEKSWLAEFDRLKHEYKSKWETCTHSADEFCGLLYHSGDQQQQKYLLHEYPLLMDAWRHANLVATPHRVRLDWPAVRIAYDVPIQYCAAASGESGVRCTTPAAPARRVLATPALHCALDALRGEFAWRREDVLALTTHLEVLGVVSCGDLAGALEMRGGRFERNLQGPTFPRLTRAICRSLLSHARHLTKSE